MAMLFIAGMLLNGCGESTKPITLPNGKQGYEYTSLMQMADTRNALNRYTKMYDSGFRMRTSLVNIPGSKRVTLKVKAYVTGNQNYKMALTPGSGGLKPTLMTNIPKQTTGAFSLYPMILNGVKPLLCKSGNEPGTTIKHLECEYDKQALIKSIGKLDGLVGGKQWPINGFMVDETNDGTPSEAWKCSQPYTQELFAAKSINETKAVRQKQQSCIAQKYGITLRTDLLGLKDNINTKLSYEQIMFGKKHYRLGVRSNEDLLRFLSK